MKETHKKSKLPAFITEKAGKTKTNKFEVENLFVLFLKLNTSIKKRDFEAQNNQK